VTGGRLGRQNNSDHNSHRRLRAHVTDDRTVHRRVRNLVPKTVDRTTGDLMRTDPRGFPAWPEAVTASLRGRIH
jgi:hypothetical protein